ncbi:MAG: ATP-binding cassette domain-containing protein, partial [Thermomicrobiales bacterium]|nr:ATP-binding cassette domain-containing protein [Thermomicrobiales bacterium]
MPVPHAASPDAAAFAPELPGGRRADGASPLIQVRDLSGGYGGAPVLRGVSLEIPRGQFAGLVGPSGAGKTSLLRALLGGLPQVSGEVRVEGALVAPGRPPQGVGYVPQVQTVDWTFPVTVEDVVLMGRTRRMGPLPWPSRADRRAVDETLERLGLGGLRRRHIRELSGGQQQRVFLARALIGEPDLLILDEPTASVDVKTRDDILHLLA